MKKSGGIGANDCSERVDVWCEDAARVVEVVRVPNAIDIELCETVVVHPGNVVPIAIEDGQRGASVIDRRSPAVVANENIHHVGLSRIGPTISADGHKRIVIRIRAFRKHPPIYLVRWLPEFIRGEDITLHPKSN